MTTIPWTEKYRPKNIDEISGQNEVIDVLRKTSNSLSHLLFYGSPGIGKTTSILALCRQIYGEEFKNRVMILNASDDRGIDVVRTKIKNFANLSINTSIDCPEFKVIILDEADSMTYDAQTALRRIIEKYTKVTRFCIICNYISKIIDPLISRCAKFKFTPLPKKCIVDRLTYIAKCENLDVEPSSFDKIFNVSKGDMRKAITLMQGTSMVTNGIIYNDAIDEIIGIIPDSIVENIWKQIESNDIDNIKNSVHEFILNGFSTAILLEQLGKHIKDLETDNGDNGVPASESSIICESDIRSFSTKVDSRKAMMLLSLAKTDKKIRDGADEELQLLNTFFGFVM